MCATGPRPCVPSTTKYRLYSVRVRGDLAHGIAGPGDEHEGERAALCVGEHAFQPFVRLTFPLLLDVRHCHAIGHRRPGKGERIGDNVKDVQRSVERLGEHATVSDGHLGRFTESKRRESS